MFLRNKMIDRIDVLNKVKELFLIPKLEMMPMHAVATFYGVEYKTAKQCYLRNRKEIDLDGVIHQTSKQIRELLQHVVVFKKVSNTCWAVKINEDTNYTIPNHTTFFSPRAVLRIGMLLRDSEVAKEVRTQLLNTFLYRTNTPTN